ncbi:MAG: gliding motility-associated C-terminal domain-containing protein [Muribaculaceae bacterium]|nr:gliding motility-associated C-terminal domain-containing protein [Muribaculaceae bacterium]
MKHTAFSIILTAVSATFISTPLAAADLNFSNTSQKPVSITPDKNTGLDRIYVLESMDNVVVSFRSTSNSPVWYRYSTLGGGYAEEVESSFANGVSTLLNPEGDRGYIIEDGDKRFYFWLVNYGPKTFVLHSVEYSNDSSCDESILNIDCAAEPIVYYTINGQRRVLDRNIKIEYLNLSWDRENETYTQGSVVKTVESIEGPVRLTPPIYCPTTFTVTGDTFLEKWGKTVTEESPYIEPIAVICETKATQTPAPESEYESNILKGETTDLGGSAPAEITFEAFVSDAVLHDEWQMSRYPDFDNVDYRFTTRVLTYTFNEEGTFYLRYMGSNADGSCETIGDTYTVNIGDSQLLCPNAFTPNGDGVNDVWRVAYRSLIDFKCWIFDRYGKQMYHFEDPAGGWDGAGANPGVYYYVIQATGADGKKYKKSGDINILRHTGKTGSASSPTE